MRLAAYIAGAALVLSGFAVVRGEMRQRRENRRRLATGPSELREVVVEIRTLFESVIDTGGDTEPFFADAEVRRKGQTVVDLTERVEDADLQSSLDRINGAWGHVTAHAPPDRVRMYFAGQTDPVYVQQWECQLELAPPQDIDDRGNCQKQVEHAKQGKEACEAALVRLNALER